MDEAIPAEEQREGRDVKLTERIARYFCPTLKDELVALRSGNTKIVLENARLMDEIAARLAISADNGGEEA